MKITRRNTRHSTLARARDLARLPVGGWGETMQARQALLDILMAWTGATKTYRLPAGSPTTDADHAVEAWTRLVAVRI